MSAAPYEPMVLVSYKPIVFVGCISTVMHIPHAGTKHKTLPCTEAYMSTMDFIMALFCQVDDQMASIPRHPHATMWPSEVRHPRALPYAQRRWQPCVLSLADARLSSVVSPAPRARPALAPLPDASGLDTGLLGLSNGARGRIPVGCRYGDGPLTSRLCGVNQLFFSLSSKTANISPLACLIRPVFLQCFLRQEKWALIMASATPAIHVPGEF